MSNLQIGNIKRVKSMKYTCYDTGDIPQIWGHSVSTLYRKLPLIGWLPFRRILKFHPNDPTQ